MKFTAEEIEVLHAVRNYAIHMISSRFTGESWIGSCTSWTWTKDVKLFEDSTKCDARKIYSSWEIVSLMSQAIWEAENETDR